MSNALDDLIQGWRGCDFSKPPFWFLGDRDALATDTEVRIATSWQELTGRGVGQKALHMGLLPVPYAGNLSSASIFILMMNPGQSDGDYDAEYGSSTYRDTHIRNLRQEGNEEYPLHFLNPAFDFTPPHRFWWGKKLRSLTKDLAARASCSEEAMRKLLSHRVASLELVPYHARKPDYDHARHLRSSAAMRRYVHESLQPRAEAGEVLLIAVRGVGAGGWKLSESRNVVVYHGHEPQLALLSPGSRGGKAITEFLGLT